MNYLSEKNMKSKRFAAFTVDIILAIIISMVVSWIINSLFHIELSSQMTAALAWAIMFSKDCVNGMSVGKRIGGIQVIDSRTKEIANPIKCVVRNLFYSLGFIDLIVMAFHSKELRLGDYVAHTEVVQRDRTLQNIHVSKIVIAIGYVVIGLIIAEVIVYFHAS